MCKRAKSCNQLIDREGFDEVIVSSTVQPAYTLVYFAQGRQHENCSRQPALARTRQEIQSIVLAEHQIKDDDIMFG
ncbi:Uncharacterised protein [Brevundimonas diminuta]|nr:Uncharacterised protein [Brevundimonas diminuta]SUW16174.1 Uncharacterised protein [Brevundimonas diminuta]